MNCVLSLLFLLPCDQWLDEAEQSHLLCKAAPTRRAGGRRCGTVGYTEAFERLRSNFETTG